MTLSRRHGEPTDAALVALLTEPVALPLTPALRLHLARDPRGIWETVEGARSQDDAKRPFWAFAWPGGQALARYLLDHPDVAAGRRVLDIGAGSGVACIAALKAGAASALANDIDPLAIAASRLNAGINGVTLTTSTADLLGGTIGNADMILLSDIVYEPELLTRVSGFIDAMRARDIPVLFGDRGTTKLPMRRAQRLAEYAADVVPPMIEGQFERGLVWRV
jgi:predicted nicotinamide N-methyase